MKRILLLFIFLTCANAHEYTIYNMNGKNHGSFNGILNKTTLSKFVKENHGSVIVVKKSPNNTSSLKYLTQKHLGIAQIKQIEKDIDLNSDSLNREFWLEVEKNETIKICTDRKVLAWETELKSSILNDSCLAFQTPQLIGVDYINVYFPESDSSHKINLAVGMKYLNFKNEEVVLGYNEENDEFYRNWGFPSNYDIERFTKITGSFLVDEYPVTNCEFLKLMWDSIPVKAFDNWIKKDLNEWTFRKKNRKYNDDCLAHDTAATRITIIQAMKYANIRSINDGLKPYYLFSETDADDEKILSDGYTISSLDFANYKNLFIKVSLDKTSDGYRLPYLDEWMMMARAGDKKNKAPWGNSSATFDEARKHAKFTVDVSKSYYNSEPVGQLQPNGYGLYDIFGLTEERVLLKKELFCNFSYPTLLKGGTYTIDTTGKSDLQSRPYWKNLNYGYFGTGALIFSGFRLIRNIGNNASWHHIRNKVEID